MRSLPSLAVASVLAFAGVTLRAQSGNATLEYQVKAAYVLNFLSFTEWPPASFDGPASPLHVCVVGDNPFGSVLESTVQGEKVSGHPIAVDRLASTAAARQCHVVFVSRLNDQAGAVMKALAGAPVLTIGESATFLQSGGMVNFVIDAGRVKFDVNRQLAEAQGLKLSSRLLRLARSVM